MMKAMFVRNRFRLGCVGLLALSLVLFALLRPTDGPSTSPAAGPDRPPAPAKRAAEGGRYMLIDSERLASLPDSGAAFSRMRRWADLALAKASLTTPNARSPWLPNYDGIGAETLAAALVYARTGEERYRDFVIRVNRFLIGSEDGSSNAGQTDSEKLLATMRQISAYVMAADLVAMDPNVTGSRPGYRSTAWTPWLAALRTKTIGSGNCSSIVDCNRKATNWGAWASAARIAIDIYLGDTADLDAAVGRLKLYLGETFEGEPWARSGSYDRSWACIPSGLQVAFVPVNPSSCGQEKDGIIVEDASRSDAPFPSWNDVGIDYTFHAYTAQLVAALLLDRRGYDVWNWGEQALRRVMDRLEHLGVATGNGRESATHASWVARYVYGADYPTAPADPGNTLGYTDWLFGPSELGFGKLARNTSTGSALLTVRVPAAGKVVLRGRGMRKIRKRVPRGGALKLRVRPTRNTRKALGRTGRVKVRAKLIFYPAGGNPQTLMKTIRLLKRR